MDMLLPILGFSSQIMLAVRKTGQLILVHYQHPDKLFIINFAKQILIFIQVEKLAIRAL